MVGYDAVLLQWLSQCMGSRGHIYNMQTRQLFNVKLALPQQALLHASAGNYSFWRVIAFKFGAAGSSVFLFFSTSSLVCFALRETQARMLRFTYLLQHHIQNGLPIVQLVTTHATESLMMVPVMVGILFFLRAFFSDQVLAFLVLSLVWFAEVFSVTSLRTSVATNFFPRAYCIYFVAFLLYHLHHPTGFCYTALTGSFLLIFHSMLYCLNKCEIPALESGLIHAYAPREGQAVFVVDDANNTTTERVRSGSGGQSQASPTRHRSNVTATNNSAANERSPHRRRSNSNRTARMLRDVAVSVNLSREIEQRQMAHLLHRGLLAGDMRAAPRQRTGSSTLTSSNTNATIHPIAPAAEAENRWLPFRLFGSPAMEHTATSTAVGLPLDDAEMEPMDSHMSLSRRGSHDIQSSSSVAQVAANTQNNEKNSYHLAKNDSQTNFVFGILDMD